jgi:hypothetical protein
LTRYPSPITYYFYHRAISSVVERLLHTQEVAGSNPASRTTFKGAVAAATSRRFEPCIAHHIVKRHWLARAKVGGGLGLEETVADADALRCSNPLALFPANASYDDFSSACTPQNRSPAKQLSACFRRLY